MSTSDIGVEVPDLTWNDALLMGYPAMDTTHEEFVRVLHELRSSADEQLPARLQALREHLEQHFAQEDRWMAETGFPPRDCHIDEHAAVLRSVREVQALMEQGGHEAVCRDLASELARWFPGHADYLDSALAAWMCKQRHGGKPVVVRRLAPQNKEQSS